MSLGEKELREPEEVEVPDWIGEAARDHELPGLRPRDDLEEGAVPRGGVRGGRQASVAIQPKPRRYPQKPDRSVEKKDRLPGQVGCDSEYGWDGDDSADGRSRRVDADCEAASRPFEYLANSLGRCHPQAGFTEPEAETKDAKQKSRGCEGSRRLRRRPEGDKDGHASPRSDGVAEEAGERISKRRGQKEQADDVAVAGVGEVQLGLYARRNARQALPVKVVHKRHKEQQRNNKPWICSQRFKHAASPARYTKESGWCLAVRQQLDRHRAGRQWSLEPQPPLRLMVLRYVCQNLTLVICDGEGRDTPGHDAFWMRQQHRLHRVIEVGVESEHDLVKDL